MSFIYYDETGLDSVKHCSGHASDVALMDGTLDFDSFARVVPMVKRIQYHVSILINPLDEIIFVCLRLEDNFFDISLSHYRVVEFDCDGVF